MLTCGEFQKQYPAWPVGESHTHYSHLNGNPESLKNSLINRHFPVRHFIDQSVYKINQITETLVNQRWRVYTWQNRTCGKA